jgi:hypothetical protein
MLPEGKDEVSVTLLPPQSIGTTLDVMIGAWFLITVIAIALEAAVVHGPTTVRAK